MKGIQICWFEKMHHACKIRTSHKRSFLAEASIRTESRQQENNDIEEKMRVAKTESGNTRWSRNECTTLVRSCFRASFKVTPMPSKANSEEKVFGQL